MNHDEASSSNNREASQLFYAEKRIKCNCITNNATSVVSTSPAVSGRSACLCVCLSVSQNPRVQISPNFLKMSPVAVTPSSSDNSVCISGCVDDVIFLPLDAVAMLARYMLSSCVCPSVCLSQADTVQKRLNIRSCRTIARGL